MTKTEKQVSLANFPVLQGPYIAEENTFVGEVLRWIKDFKELLRLKLTEAEKKSIKWSSITYPEGQRDLLKELLGSAEPSKEGLEEKKP